MFPLSMRVLAHRGRHALALLTLLLISSFVAASTASATTKADIFRALASQNVFVHPAENHPGDLQRLEQAAQSNASQGLPAKFAILQSYPTNIYSSASAVASDFRHSLGFSGVLIVVTPRDIGLSSDKLSAGEETKIAQQAAPRCLTQTLAACAIFAGSQAVSKFKADKSASNRNIAIFWIVVLVILALVILGVVFAARRRLSAITGRRNDLYQAASNTLSLADSAVEEIESATAAQPMDAGLRADYDRALALRDQARNELDRAQSPEMLTQANQDAAQAVLALQGVMKSLGISSPLANPLQAPAGHRCFYCGRDDRPPYTTETIEDGRGNSMEVEVCSVDQQRIAQGRRPEVATVNYSGTTVPWWAVPGNPYYYNYGGPSWQNWLPFFAGVELGSWFGGGWGYGDYDDRGWAGGDAASSAVGADVPSDASGVNFGGPADSSGWDTGGGDSGSDSGGWDSGGDSGGWDSGGGDWGGDSGSGNGW